MKDKLGNPLEVGDAVVFCTTGRFAEIRVAIIREISDSNVIIKSEGSYGRLIKRYYLDVIKYLGDKNGIQG